jgi:pimeloyl-ACP methyl ester carboxylesterase
MTNTKHVVLIHGTWLHGDTWADTRREFERRGFTVHTPTLRFHDLPIDEGAQKMKALSLRDYADDLVGLVESLDSPPLILGHSMGGLIAQLVAARTQHAGLVLASTAAAAGIWALYPGSLRVFSHHYLPPAPWDKPLYPSPWKVYRHYISNTHTDEEARELYDVAVCESGRAYCEMGFAQLDRYHAARVDFAAVAGPVLAIAGGSDKLVNPRISRTTASKYRNGTYVEMPGIDHIVFTGGSLAITMSHIDEWMKRNNLLTVA